MKLTPEEIQPKLKKISLGYLIAGIAANILTPYAAYFYKSFQDDLLPLGMALNKAIHLQYIHPNVSKVMALYNVHLTVFGVLAFIILWRSSSTCTANTAMHRLIGITSSGLCMFAITFFTYYLMFNSHGSTSGLAIVFAPIYAIVFAFPAFLVAWIWSRRIYLDGK